MPKRKSKALDISPEDARLSGTFYRIGLAFSHVDTEGTTSETLGWYRSSSDAFDEVIGMTRRHLRRLVEPHLKRDGKRLERVVVLVEEFLLNEGQVAYQAAVYEGPHDVSFRDDGAFSLRALRFGH